MNQMIWENLILKGTLAVVFSVLSLFAIQAYSDPVPVTTRKLADVAFFPIRHAPARVMSLNDTRVSSEIKGILQNFKVRVGDSVKKDDIIATIDCTDYEIIVEQAKAAYESGKAEYRFKKSQLEKAKQLSGKNSISSEEVDRRRSSESSSAAEVDGLRAALRAARHAVGKCSLHAPFDAVVVQRIASLGDYLVPGSAVIRLLDKEHIEISGKVQEQDLNSLKEAQEAVFIVRDRRYPLQLRTILPLMESRIRSYEVRLEFKEEKAAPGTTGRLQWIIEKAHVPADLLVRHNKDLGIFLEKNGIAEFVPIEDARAGQPASIDIADTANVIIDGRFGVKQGEAVLVKEP